MRKGKDMHVEGKEHFREEKVRMCMCREKQQCRERKVMYVDGKESLEGEKDKNMHVGIERNYFREGK